MLKKYNSFKDSQIEWIGEIPNHWQVKRLKFVADVMPSNVDKKSNEGEKEILLCNYVDVYKNDFINSELSFMTATAPDSQIEKFTLKSGDVIVTKDSEDPNDIAVPALVVENLDDVVCGYHLSLIRANDIVLFGGYLFWLLKSKNYCQYFSTQANGVTRYGIGTYSFKNVNIPLPTRNEQFLISKYLNLKTRLINKLINDKEKLVDVLKEELNAIIKNAITKGIDKGLQMKDTGIEWIGQIPIHWSVKKIRFVFSCLNTIRVPLNSEERAAMTIKKYDYYGASGVIDKVENFLFEEPLILLGEDGANLLTRSKRLSFIAEGRYWVNNHAHILKPLNGNINYLCELLELIDYSIYVSGSAQPKLTKEALLAIEIIEPPLLEQDEIFDYINCETVRINKIINKIKIEVENLKEYKTALISEVVTGKVDVTHEVISEPLVTT